MRYTITTQKELRRLFWAENTRLSRRKIKDHSGIGTMYTTDTRCAFVDFVDYLQKDGQISESLAARVTL